jgi:hypothetical protein
MYVHLPNVHNDLDLFNWYSILRHLYLNLHQETPQASKKITCCLCQFIMLCNQNVGGNERHRETK